MRFLLSVVLLLATISSSTAQNKKVEFTTFQLSDTIYMLRGSGGNVGISTGEDGLYIIDDQVSPVTPQLLEVIRKISDKPIKFVI
jgi:alkyl sulfatase BDS1-like metallo-beta-lactamase superfamily hydrolase